MSLPLRALSPDGAQEVVGAQPLQVALEGDDYRLGSVVLPSARSVLGADAVLLGADRHGVVEVEVVGSSLAPGLSWRPLAADRSSRESWEQPGWYAATCAAIDEVLARLGRPRSGPVLQERIWSIAALMRVPSDGGELWFKQVPPIFAHEGRLTAWLSERSPASVPRVVHVGPDWWLAEAIAPSVREFTDMTPFAVLGELQRATVGREEELLALGCADRRLPRLLPELYDAMGQPPLHESQWSGLLAARPQLEDAVGRLAGVGLPDALVHGDFHGGNASGTADGWVVYDWTDGCVAHPLLDVQPIAMARSWSDDVLAQGLSHWWPGVELSAQDWAAARVVGMAHQLVSYRRITVAIGGTGEGDWARETRRFADELLALLAAD